jgi:hypothetical protein
MRGETLRFVPYVLETCSGGWPHNVWLAQGSRPLLIGDGLGAAVKNVT